MMERLSFNIADVVVLVIIGFCVYFYYNRGLISTLFGFCSTLLSIVLSRLLSPFAADILRKTSIFESIKEYIGKSIVENGTGGESGFISNLGIPDFLKTALLDNDNKEVYKALNVTNPKDYVSEYIASFVINIIAMIIVFVLVFVLIKVLANTLNIVSKLPVLRTANKLGGGALGLVQAVLIIWIGLAVLTMLYGKPMFNDANEAVANSLIASKFYDSNILIKGLSAIGNLL